MFIHALSECDDRRAHQGNVSWNGWGWECGRLTLKASLSRMMQGQKRWTTRGRAFSYNVSTWNKCPSEWQAAVNCADGCWQDDTHTHGDSSMDTCTHAHAQAHTPLSTLLVCHLKAMLPAGRHNLSFVGHLSHHIWPISVEFSDSPPPCYLSHQHLPDFPFLHLISRNGSKGVRLNVCLACGTTTVATEC